MKESEKFWLYSTGLAIMFVGLSLLTSIFPAELKIIGGAIFLLLGFYILGIALKEKKRRK